MRSEKTSKKLEELKKIFIVPVKKDEDWIKKELRCMIEKGVKIMMPERVVIFTKSHTHKKPMLEARALSLLSVMEERD